MSDKTDKTAVFLASVENMVDEEINNLIQDIERVGKEYGINIFFDEMIEFTEIE
jgi:hypothetical protein